ncbi:LemA protein [Flavobacterium sp. 7E]|uniref:LemA family protein n=1 Tax=unclassified Flavobacterium TaxID=196869 RepID=UPI00156F9CC9|nr:MULTISPECIES: LemA family protein [unclassified Flavobacterium]MBE0390815.1 hypothetical protein [Flavobacterium sp. PL002]NRS87526.1 LemA protein [Flavobacterium sp. 7E]
MTNLFISLVVCIVLVLVMLIITFNKLSVKKNQISNAISSLDALFIKRTDLIPNLISVVKKYVNYEKETLEAITKLRTSNGNDYLKDDQTTKLMKSLMINVENYPELKANTQFTNLQYSFNECEEQIAAGRRFLSSSITDYNDQVVVFPSNIIAGLFGFKIHQWEFATEKQRENVDAETLMN